MELIQDDENFYSDANKYFTYLRRIGSTDYGFEDEFFFTMPALSG
ncbi:MAG: hypothetical protein K8823_618 [Cenarchaeum symbiont of Oopsacas minuta]|nr:hypothetical protein [Cenarchaeum symbiont of Oopsacas minuta]